LAKIAALEPKSFAKMGYMSALKLYLARKPALQKYASSVMYRTLGKVLPKNMESAAPLLGVSMLYAHKYFDAVKRVGYHGNRRTLGNSLFEAVLEGKSGVIISKHHYEEVWSLVKTPDKRIYLEIPEMILELRQLAKENLENNDFPFILMAGERRIYNANQIYRDAAWRKVDTQGAMHMHPDDAIALGIGKGSTVICESSRGHITAVVELDKGLRRNVVTLPNGYGLRFQNNEPIGPPINILTSSGHCDPLTKTPFHKYVPVKITKV
jgi:anaerobic selenocysteine-containing dehydrogenase